MVLKNNGYILDLYVTIAVQQSLQMHAQTSWFLMWACLNHAWPFPSILNSVQSVVSFDQSWAGVCMRTCAEWEVTSFCPVHG